MIDGGPGAAPAGRLSAWLVTDIRAELIREIRALAWRHRLEPEVETYLGQQGLAVIPRAVRHTSHPTFGYAITIEGKRVAWLPEFFEFPDWADGFDLVFADAAGYDRPIRFARRAGGHACVLDVSLQARERGVRRLVFAHIGRPTIRAMDARRRPEFGEFGHDGQVFIVTRAGIRLASPTDLSQRRRELERIHGAFLTDQQRMRRRNVTPA